MSKPAKTVDDNRVYLYDTTLRDGAQTQGVNFSVSDKIAIALALDDLGIDYVEGGWPGANPTDDAFFAQAPALSRAKFTAFGMTRRPGRSTDNDPGLAALIGADAGVVCMVGKTWDFHVDVALDTEPEENLAMIADSVARAGAKGKEVIFDAEHFFDGYKANPDYALDCIAAAYDAGARWVVLCDTNGGTLPHEVASVVAAAIARVPGSHLGIHAHNDTENAVANSLAAVSAGARHVQGTINGLGERCGNANLASLIPSLKLKMGFETGVTDEGLAHLTHVSHLVYERLNQSPVRNQPFVGESAFSHKGGLHVSAVAKDPATYEHIDPALVGNQRHIVVSDQSGRANILARFREIGIDLAPNLKDAKVERLVEAVKMREHQGYAYDDAEASFELLARRALGKVPEYFKLTSFRVIDERRWNARGELITLSEATIKIEVEGQPTMPVAEGNGPVNALDGALKEALISHYPSLADLRLVDYKVRILTPEDATAAITRVMIESADDQGVRWSTVGVSGNVIDASYNALHDSITWKLHRDGVSV